MVKTLRNKRGFTLVELMIVVAIVGVLAALAIYGVRKYIANAKTAEARNSLGQMAKDASAAYSREGMSAAVLSLGSSAGASNHLCGSATISVPAAQAAIAGKKYQSSPAEWTSPVDANGNPAGWTCLKFSMQDPQYYMYSYTASGIQGVAGETFQTRAQGDLNGDGTLSDFQLLGSIQAVGQALTVTIAPNISEKDPEE